MRAGRLTEWLKLALDQPDLLQKLGAKPNLGVLITGPAGVGKARLVGGLRRTATGPARRSRTPAHWQQTNASRPSPGRWPM